MKKIKKEDIGKSIRYLKSIDFKQYSKKSYIFLPIENTRNEDFDGLEMIIKGTGTASKKEYMPGLILISNEEKGTSVELAYANIDYSPAFDMVQFLELTGENISKNLKEFLSEYETLLVNTDYIAATFDI